ncbi:hypothetical protein G9P44_004875 [Scheffersomyces stipitis]|nr:hypothetical protein G9P44_004875 [Scheffersomyces stipitis]
MTHVTILTGASKGIGRSIAEVLLKKDASYKLIAVARSGSDLNELVKQFGADRVGVVVGDVTEAETSQKAVNLAVSKFGQLDSVIANAGVLDPVGPFQSVDIAKWRRLFDINYFSVIELIQASLPELRKTKGNVIAVSSGASTKPYSGWHAYGGSKAAVNHLIASVAADEPDVSALSIAPGVVDTSMQKDIREKFGKGMDPESLKRFIDLHANNELLQPDVPARVYVNLATEGWSKDIDGQYLRFNDGVLKKYA